MTDQNFSGASTPKGRRNDVVAAEKDKYGGMKFGSAFFGWLTATGMAALLTALASAIGVAIATNTSPDRITGQTLRTVGIVSVIVVAIILFIAYFAGGYVAARMARFSGVKQGLGVWLWAVIATIVVGVLGVIAGSELDLLSRANGLPRLPMDDGTRTGSIITIAAIVLISLVGALLGGLAGMRYHRRVDRAGFEDA